MHRMRLVKTKDNSFTMFSERYQEHYHSVTGALEEAEKKFVIPCKISAGVRILDIGFGLGYNSGMAIQKAGRVRIIGLENDADVLKEIQGIEVPYLFRNSYEKIRKAASSLDYKDEFVEIKILLGDAREMIKRIDEKFDAVFLDAFSPPKNPEMWTAEFFKEVFDRMKTGGILATYSCAGIVRRNLKEVGFEVKDGPVVGRRSPGTLAIRSL